MRQFETLNEPLSRRVTTGLARVGAALRTAAWAGGERAGLTPTQGQVLSYLARLGPARLGAVAEELAITPQTASTSVRALEDKGLVRKTSDARDRRAVALELTGAGRATAATVATWADALIGAVDGLDREEQTVLLRVLIKVIRRLQLDGHIPVARMCVSCRHFRPHAHPGEPAPHHCAFVDAAFGDRDLRLDCADHDAAPAELARRMWTVFTGGRDARNP